MEKDFNRFVKELHNVNNEAQGGEGEKEIRFSDLGKELYLPKTKVHGGTNLCPSEVESLSGVHALAGSPKKPRPKPDCVGRRQSQEAGVVHRENKEGNLLDFIVNFLVFQQYRRVNIKKTKIDLRNRFLGSI